MYTLKCQRVVLNMLCPQQNATITNELVVDFTEIKTNTIFSKLLQNLIIYSFIDGKNHIFNYKNEFRRLNSFERVNDV